MPVKQEEQHSKAGDSKLVLVFKHSKREEFRWFLRMALCFFQSETVFNTYEEFLVGSRNFFCFFNHGQQVITCSSVSTQS
jgi:hypothetical protein